MGYKGILGKIAPKRGMTTGILALFFVLTWGASAVLPGGFIPTEDQGMIYVNITTPPGATMERTEKILDEVQRIASAMPQVENVTTLAGYSLLTETAGASYGMGMIGLKPWDDRAEKVPELMEILRKQTLHLKDAAIEFFPPPAVPGFGNASGFEFRLLDKSGTANLNRMAEVSDTLLKALRQSPVIGAAFTNFDPTFPQYMLHVNQDLAAAKGVSIDNAMGNLQTLVGSFYATNFIRFGQMYKVMVQALPEYRQHPEDILKLYTKSENGEMVSYASFMTIERVFGPEQLTRYNMYNSAMITGDAAPGSSSAEAIAAISETAQKVLPRGYDFEFSGMTREQVLAGNEAVYIFVLCLIFVYLILSAQYESFLLPLPVLLSLPTGIFGSFFFLWAMDLENNIYAQVALVMLIGLLGKNAILVVEFALQRQKEGVSELKAAMEGAVSRLRPILMTSFAFIAGLLPLVLASGAGELGNKSIGVAAAGGMLTGTLFGLLIISGLFVVFAAPGRRKRLKALQKQRTAKPYHYE
jgi:HAE1 family hydrophobic/amphiphilic exporter-1